GISLSTHALFNLLEWSRIELPKPTRALQFASICFDASFYEIFTSLQSGGTVFLVADEIRYDVQALARFMTMHAIQAATLPVVVLQSMVNIAPSETVNLSALTAIIATGEALSVTPKLIEFVRKGESRYLYNHYGPSETHVVTAYTVQFDDASGASLPPIGRPIANSQIYILDSAFEPVPAGVTGELYIAGDGLARGYLNRPGLTAEKFIPNPFSRVAGARMYRSGDLARYLPDGNIEYLGRGDQQVKIRGFRIELGEIEEALFALSEVRDGVVLVREDDPGDKRLVAYVVPHDAVVFDGAALRTALSRTLPDYMIPVHFIALENLPLTSNGKIDRKALPAPDMTRHDNGYVAPRTQTEKVLAGIWSEILKLDRVGVHDNFFTIGGHSLMA
ncbi:AMP-binding protein, partial [Collimonas pratensis]|uniref:non-ribosomal peptide synthetase n=1 Tax=Collimonas pratensis TaxID=279113 RepID=UPI00143CC725